MSGGLAIHFGTGADDGAFVGRRLKQTAREQDAEPDNGRSQEPQAWRGPASKAAQNACNGHQRKDNPDHHFLGLEQ